MGLTNWFLKNGPGSPGRTAKSFIREYNKISTGNHDEDWELIFHTLFMQRYQANQRHGFGGGSLFEQTDANEIVEFSDGDMGLFVFCMMLIETSNFRNNINNTFNEVTSVIHEVVRLKAPSTLKFDLPTFRLKASQL